MGVGATSCSLFHSKWAWNSPEELTIVGAAHVPRHSSAFPHSISLATPRQTARERHDLVGDQ